MSLAQRMAQRMIELQRARQRAIDRALRTGSRPAFDDRGRVILVKGGDHGKDARISPRGSRGV